MLIYCIRGRRSLEEEALEYEVRRRLKSCELQRESEHAGSALGSDFSWLRWTREPGEPRWLI